MSISKLNTVQFIHKYVKGFFIGIFCLLSSTIYSQGFYTSPSANSYTQPIFTNKCLTDLILQQKLQNNPAFMSKQNQMNQLIAAHQNSGARQVLNIPVVVHVINMGGPENIPDQQIFDGISYLNAAFANAGVYNHPNGVNTDIQFCLAQRDPNGGYTTGINRIFSPLTNLTAETDDIALKNLIVWNTQLYLNIWLVNEITSFSLGAGIAGYATLPSSAGLATDGIVNEAAFFGSSADNSKVHIHEAGHYLGLYHTFEGGCVNNNCQNDGDKVCDTPPDNSTAPVACNATVNTCTNDADDASLNNPFRSLALGGFGDQPDLFRNYMDYGYQTCQIYFTAGQSERMNAALLTSRQLLTTSNGCTSVCTIPMTLAIIASDTTVDIGTLVHFTGVSSNTNAVEWKINNVQVSNVDSFDNVFNTPGFYTISFTGFNTDVNCTQTVNLVIEVSCTSHASFQLSPAGALIVGSTISASSTSIGATTFKWVLDGSVISTNATWSQLYNIPGGHSIYLITSNGLCSDTSGTNFFQIGNCDLSGVTNNWVTIGNVFNFSSVNPTNIGGSPILNPSTECTSSISDVDGNLLLFSDGNTCWDKNQNQMPNGFGLLGNVSSTQSVLITPHPGNPNQFYVFTTDAVENYFANGVRYSIVDMTLNGGLGDIIPATKNTLVAAFGSEKLTATSHANGRDIWVATSDFNNDNKYAFLIDNAGFHPQPVITHIGNSSEMGLGSMKFSQDGNRMAECLFSPWPWRILVTDFNKQTGVFSNPIELILSNVVNEQAFGLEFSPDNSKLYVSLWQGSDIYQYDLSQTTASQIMASRVAIDPFPLATFGHLVLAKNGKIYVNHYQNSGVDVINEPNLAGISCNYQQNVIGINIDPGSTLPNMLQGYLGAHQPKIAGPINICVGGETYSYGIALESAQDSVIWSHAGNAVFSSQIGVNTATLASPNTNTTDTLRAIIYGRCGISFDTLIVKSNFPELAFLSDTTYFCDSIQLAPGANFLTYEWQDLSNSSTLWVDSAAVYWVKMKGESGCIVTDTTRAILFNISQPLDLGNDVIICKGQVTLLQTATNYSNYLWQDGSINATFTAYQAGLYWLTASDLCGGLYTDTVEVLTTQNNLNLAYNGNDSICETALPFTLNAPAGYANYLWNDGSSAQTLVVNSVGTYWLKATNDLGCYALDSVWVYNCSLTDIFAIDNDITWFPNPAHDKISLKGKRQTATTLVNIYSTIGELVYTTQWTGLSLEICTLNFANGLYFVQRGTSKTKIIVHH